MARPILPERVRDLNVNVVAPEPELPPRAQLYDALRTLFERAIWGNSWPGRSGPTDRCAYLSLLREAWQRPDQSNAVAGRHYVGLSLSVRELSMRAGITRRTTEKALQRLEEAGLLRRVNRGPEGIRPTRLLLMIPDEPHETTTLGVLRSISSPSMLLVEECHTFCTAPRPPLLWGYSSGGKLAEWLLDLLQLAPGLSTEQLAQFTGRSSRSLTREGGPLNTLRGAGVIDRTPGERWRLHRYWKSHLGFSREFSGEREATDRRREATRREQAAFAEQWRAGAVLSRLELKKRLMAIKRLREEAKDAHRQRRLEERARVIEHYLKSPKPERQEAPPEPEDRETPRRPGESVLEPLEPELAVMLEAIRRFEEKFGPGSFRWDRRGAKQMFYRGPISGIWPDPGELVAIRPHYQAK